MAMQMGETDPRPPTTEPQFSSDEGLREDHPQTSQIWWTIGSSRLLHRSLFYLEWAGSVNIRKMPVLQNTSHKLSQDMTDADHLKWSLKCH